MEKKFVKLHTGIVINIERICFVGSINAVKSSPRAKKAVRWDLTIKFINDDEPVTFKYFYENEARGDYNSLVTALTNAD